MIELLRDTVEGPLVSLSFAHGENLPHFEDKNPDRWHIHLQPVHTMIGLFRDTVVGHFIRWISHGRMVYFLWTKTWIASPFSSLRD